MSRPHLNDGDFDAFQNGNVSSSQKINNLEGRGDFGKVIGDYIDPHSKRATPTTNGIILNSKTGVYIIPVQP
ncbi:polymorphic toxin type 50 domain-containing protein [Sphingobacterium lactis]|uniref:polymorphic toxin type 50 domain-containing protein n=1 Tax=Sphingobacterium lactis TaxID=797291 RepID=UPI003F8066B1